MILRALYDLYDRLTRDSAYDISPPGYSQQKISFKVVITPAGELFDIQDARIQDESRPRPRVLIMPGGTKPPGTVTPESVSKKVLLLRGDLPYLAGAKIQETAAGGRAKKSRSLVASTLEFEAFKQFHLAIEHEINDPAYSAVCRFLESWKPIDATDHPTWLDLAVGQGVFQILGEPGWVHEGSRVRQWWEDHERAGEAGAEGQCLVTGAMAPIARLQPMIKGVKDANPTGASLVGFNFGAVESYGRTQSFNAPVSEAAAFRYGTALNAILDGPRRERHRIRLGDMTVAFWTDRPNSAEDIFAEFASHGSGVLGSDAAQDEGVRKKLESFLRALRQGREAYSDLGEEPDQTRFYMLGLSPNNARIAVRFFEPNSLTSLLDHLRAHYRDIGIERRPAHGDYPGDPEFPPTWLLLDQTCPRRGGKADRDKIPPILAGPLFRAILTGARYPVGLFSAVLRRIQLDSIVDYPRAAVIKGYLARNLGREVSMSLDVERKDPAYRLGRLFAALEKTQLDALGRDLNSTIRDRFYSSASATPRTVFPRILRTYQHHLAKLDGGFKVNREKLVQEIVDPIVEFPAHFGLADQGLFAIGYYHQNRAFYTSKEEKSSQSEERSQRS
jgi:CRISPR-associated protein Csd1